VALAVVKITGTARRDAAEFPLTFAPAPADERPKREAAGTCSHYVAKAAFLKPTDTLTVVVEVAIFTHYAE
jgi:hypothetical protein